MLPTFFYRISRNQSVYQTFWFLFYVSTRTYVLSIIFEYLFVFLYYAKKHLDYLCDFDYLLSVLFLFLNTYFCIYEFILPYIMIYVNTHFYFFENNFTFSEINVIIYYGGDNLWVFLTTPCGKC